MGALPAAVAGAFSVSLARVFILVRQNKVRVQSPCMHSSEQAGRSRHRPDSRLRTPKAYRICDGVTEGALYGMVVFAPWAFGATERWSIWTMNVGGYILGLLLAAKWLIGWHAGYRPVRWGDADEVRNPKSEVRSANPEAGQERAGSRGPGRGRGQRRGRGVANRLAATLARVGSVILAYCFISAVNARST